MPITVTCPSCHTSLKAPDEAAGRKVKCPKCATPFAVSAHGGTLPVAGRAIKRPGPPMVHAPRGLAGPTYEDDDYKPAVRGRQEYADRRGVDQSGGAQFGLGIASLAVGAVGLLLAFIPCIGLVFGIPVAAVGLLLGVAALIVAFVRGGQGLAFPISGSVVSLVAVIIPIIWWMVVVRPAFRTAAHGIRQGAEVLKGDFGRMAEAQAAAMQKMQEEALKQQQLAMKKVQEDALKNQLPAVGPPPPGQPLGIGQPVNDRLTNADPRDKFRNRPGKGYTVPLKAGKSYRIDMMSNELDSALRLENPEGLEEARDDDSGGNLNARITYACKRDGNYRLIATTGILKSPTGGFTLLVQEDAPAVFDKEDQLTDADPKDKVRNTPCKIYNVKLQAGKTYQIDMVSNELDSYLRLEDPNGLQLMEDDDGGDALNARIRFACQRDGDYRIIATNVGPRTGRYRLTVRPGP
jgi:predicted Zn finger-like uncharacterized protein